MATVFKAPTPVPEEDGSHQRFSIFLAGSIEMNKAEDWQQVITNRFADVDNLYLINPRRESWGASTDQTTANTALVEQINWELHNIITADVVFLNFVGDTKSPISLLELGILCGKNSEYNANRVIVCCPPEFYRKANVDVTCGRFNIPVYDDFDEAFHALVDLIIERKRA